MQQVQDFLDINEDLAAILQDLPDSDWSLETGFKSWTINDVIKHLYIWNEVADLSRIDRELAGRNLDEILASLAKIGIRRTEDARETKSGRALYDAWVKQFRDMAGNWRDIDPKTRMRWAGPDMSARSMVTGRIMETWAHGQSVFDLLGLDQPTNDNIKNIVVLGMNTFGWGHIVHGESVPETVPYVELIAPSGEVWSFGPAQDNERITGLAYEFAQVVTQTRNINDTKLTVTGPVATNWMKIAQCFAGPPETPPAQGTRAKSNTVRALKHSRSKD